MVAEATIPKAVVKKTLKTSVDALVELNIAKNLIGSAMAASVGGFNAVSFDALVLLKENSNLILFFFCSLSLVKLFRN